MSNNLWSHGHPDDISDKVSISEALADLRQVDVLTDDMMARVDRFVSRNTLLALMTECSPSELADLLEMCIIAQDLADDTLYGDMMCVRWLGFEDLLEGKRFIQARTNSEVSL